MFTSTFHSIAEFREFIEAQRAEATNANAEVVRTIFQATKKGA